MASDSEGTTHGQALNRITALIHIPRAEAQIPRRRRRRIPRKAAQGLRADRAPSHQASRADESPRQSTFSTISGPPIRPRLTYLLQPAVLEEQRGDIHFWVVNNDNSRNSHIVLTGLKCMFQTQLPAMPKDYIARLVYDRNHLSIAIVKHPLEVVGGITYRPFANRSFAEIVFCAISGDQQDKGYGAHLMSHLKDFVSAYHGQEINSFLTYADNQANGYFKKQGFTKEITLSSDLWMGYIKDYEGATLMQCTIVPRMRYLRASELLLRQKWCVQSKIRAVSKSHVKHAPPIAWARAGQELPTIDPLSIPAIKATGWSRTMDTISRLPRHSPSYADLLRLLNSMQNRASAWPFLQPVNATDVPDYYNVIMQPMDLSTMEDKHERDMYPTPEEFVKDAQLIFDNCRKYNLETTQYAKSANKLEKYMWNQIKQILGWSHLVPEPFQKS